MKKITLLLCSLTLLLSACGKQVVAPDKDASGAIKNYNEVTDDTAPTKVYGKQTHMWYGALTGAGNVSANGVGFLRQFETGTYVATMNLNVEPRTDKMLYVAWLTGNGLAPYAVGPLTSLVGDARHTVNTDITTDKGAGNLSLRTNVLVTLESDASPAQPSTKVIARGTLKEAARK